MKRKILFLRDVLLHIIFPRTCFCCLADLKFGQDGPLCPSCKNGLKLLPELHCVRCGVMLSGGGAHCFHCRGSKAVRYKCKVIRSAFVFTPQIRAVIHGLKYRNKTYLAQYLAKHLLDTFLLYDELHDCQCLIPVPLSAGKFRQRGFNQSELLARELAKLSGAPMLSDALEKIKNTTSQASLNREQRLENVSDAFCVAKPELIKGKIILLIDDVATTGSTLEACAIALRKAGAKSVKALTVARE
ncbi:MAG: ComF family protein [Elusimicrobia bacterium]|nr:ComF family protein [Elusimicrobiota bacterium]